jgi:hypothetical protein
LNVSTVTTTASRVRRGLLESKSPSRAESRPGERPLDVSHGRFPKVALGKAQVLLIAEFE